MSALPCDICGAPMLPVEDFAAKYGGVAFRCTKCDQLWAHHGNGWTCTVLKTLWPSGMDENGKMFREEYLPARLAEWKHHAARNLAAGFWDQAKHDADVRNSEAKIAEWLASHPLPTPRVPRWHNLFPL